MSDVRKEMTREKRSRAFGELAARLKASAGGVPNTSQLFALLREANLNENNAVSGRLAREQLFRENPATEPPEEFADRAIAQYYVNAARLYGDAASDYVLLTDLNRAFKYYRKASVCYAAAARLRRESDRELQDKAQEYRERAAALRQKLASKDILRRRLSLGWLRRRR
ncbi:MAG: hypothetical protein ABSG68_14050 [Thermoguttaceae bacterium]|jgi:hypothetical protein